MSASNWLGSCCPTRPPPNPTSALIGLAKSHLNPIMNENVGGNGNGGNFGNLNDSEKLNTGGNLNPHNDGPLGDGANEALTEALACWSRGGASGGGGDPMPPMLPRPRKIDLPWDWSPNQQRCATDAGVGLPKRGHLLLRLHHEGSVDPRGEQRG